MSKLYTDFFDEERQQFWKKLKCFSEIGILAGGTALAMQLKHRISYDFDVFSTKSIGSRLILKVREAFGERNIQIMVDSGDELTIIYKDDIKLSFVFFPFAPISEIIKTNSLSIFTIDDLLANKAYALGRRGAWRDYADIFWSLENNISDLGTIIKNTQKKFSGLFSEKLFLEQLVYFNDINEKTIEWTDKNYSNIEIENKLKEVVEKYIGII